MFQFGLFSVLFELPTVINPAIQFMTYESVKRRLRFRYGDREFSSLVYFLVGAVAKTVATVLTYPLQIVQTKLRVCILLCTVKLYVLDSGLELTY